jgi:hypothetical protein
LRIKNLFFALIALLGVSFSGSCFAAGVGILDASKQTDISITCPVGVINCDAYTTRDAEVSKFSATGTQTFLLKLLGGVLNFAALAAVVMLVIAGIRYATALGGDEALKTARNNVIWTIVGLLVIMIALLIVRNVTSTIYESLGEKAATTAKPASTSSATTPAATTTSPAAETKTEDTSAACNPPISIPDSCYEGDINGVQTKTAAECKAAGEALIPICKMLGLSEDLGSGCTIFSIQEKLLSAGAYADATAKCSKIDGKYGQCTVAAVKAYCSKVSK